MSNIIVVFPKKENATNIRNLLVRSGLDVTGVCTSAAQAIHLADDLNEGIVVCGYKMPDMLYNELREYLPPYIEMLLIASRDKWDERQLGEGVVGLPMPIKVYDLMNTIDMMQQNMYRRKKKRREALKNRTPEQKALIDRAKALLMDRNNMSEEEAHKYLQKSSMDSGTNIVETAQMVLTIMVE